MTEPDEIVDIIPDRCAYTWTPESYSDSFCFQRVRCTAYSDTVHEHRWTTFEQDIWTRIMKERIFAAMGIEQ